MKERAKRPNIALVNGVYARGWVEEGQEFTQTRVNNTNSGVRQLRVRNSARGSSCLARVFRDEQRRGGTTVRKCNLQNGGDEGGVFHRPTVLHGSI